MEEGISALKILTGKRKETSKKTYAQMGSQYQMYLQKQLSIRRIRLIRNYWRALVNASSKCHGVSYEKYLCAQVFQINLIQYSLSVSILVYSFLLTSNFVRYMCYQLQCLIMSNTAMHLKNCSAYLTECSDNVAKFMQIKRKP